MLEDSLLFSRWNEMLADVDRDPGLLHVFARLRSTVEEQSKVIIHVFPEYTPHDATRHLDQLFVLADRVLGGDLYTRLNVAEMSLLVFGLYAHDWGMALSNEDRDAISGLIIAPDVVLIPDEVSTFQMFRDESGRLGNPETKIWEDYLRHTHARRSGYRLRKELKPLGDSFAEMVARVAEGHVLDLRELRDTHQYPLHTALFGKVANVAAVAACIRLVDLLDIAEDRTPFALWSVVRPRNEISRAEWKKHRALAPIAVTKNSGIRQVLITGTTDDPDVFASLADLRSWVDSQFSESVAFLRNIGGQYDLKLDSAIEWDIKPLGFEPVLLRFEFDRPAALGLLSAEIYGSQKLTFVRELLQNSIDAIDTRIELLRQTDTLLQGRISIKVSTLANVIRVEWNDNGVGMDRYILENYLTKIGRSWYQSSDFKRHAFIHDPVSKFGIGLLSCFAVSKSLTLTTKREPQDAKDLMGWNVRIPSREGHFRVTQSRQAQVGTTVVLEVDGTGNDLTAAAISAEIKRVAALVKYQIALQVDDLIEAIEPIKEREDPRLPFLRLASLDDAASALLQSLTVQIDHHYVSPDGALESFFSCLLPRDLSSLTSVGHHNWQFGSHKIDFEDFIIGRPGRLFLKGIAADRGRSDYRGSGLSSNSINVLRPSLVRPDLSRSHVDVHSLDLKDAWKSAASHVREAVGQDLRSVENRVAILSAASEFAGFPNDALPHLVPLADWPIWTLECSTGLCWRDAAHFLNDDEILEAPDELPYVLGSEEYFTRALRQAESWKGSTCFVAIRPHSTAPWWYRASGLALTLLDRLGFVLADLRLVNGADDDDVPLVCRVWRKQPKQFQSSPTLDLSNLLSEWRKNPLMVCPNILWRPLSSKHRSLEQLPLLFRFPEGMEKVAAIGSLYWNQNNPKVRGIVEFLLELSVRSRVGRLPGRVQQVADYVNSTDYLGHIVGSRHAGQRAGIERYRKLLDVAEKEGLPVPLPLEVDDFLPGSIGKYWNPYHYPISSWPKSKRQIGTPWKVDRA